MDSIESSKQKISVYTFGCPCRFIHNTANDVSKAVAEATGFAVGNFHVDVFYYFDNSTKCQATLKQFCEFCDQQYHKILKVGPTRWLSKEECINRILKQYTSLVSSLTSQPEVRSDPRLKR